MIKTKTKAACSIRWMIRADLQNVVEIEARAGENKWSMEDFLRRLQRRDCIGKVCVGADDTKILGYIVYELHEDHLHISNFTVDNKYQRKSIGFHMMENMKSKLSEHRRTFIEMEIRENNLEGQLFLKQMNFACDDIIKDWFDNSDESCEDGYHFTFNRED